MARRSSRSPRRGGIAARAVARISPPLIGKPGQRRHHLFRNKVPFVTVAQGVSPRRRSLPFLLSPSRRSFVRPSIKFNMVDPHYLPNRIVGRTVRRLLNCKQQSQRPTNRRRFSGGGISRQQWAISRLNRELRCKR